MGGANQILVRKVFEGIFGAQVACDLIYKFGPWWERERMTAVEWDDLALNGLRIYSRSDFVSGIRRIKDVQNMPPHMIFTEVALSKSEFLQACKRTSMIGVAHAGPS